MGRGRAALQKECRRSPARAPPGFGVRIDPPDPKRTPRGDWQGWTSCRGWVLFGRKNLTAELLLEFVDEEAPQPSSQARGSREGRARATGPAVRESGGLLLPHLGVNVVHVSASMPYDNSGRNLSFSRTRNSNPHRRLRLRLIEAIHHHVGVVTPVALLGHRG